MVAERERHSPMQAYVAERADTCYHAGLAGKLSEALSCAVKMAGTLVQRKQGVESRVVAAAARMACRSVAEELAVVGRMLESHSPSDETSSTCWWLR